MDQKPPNRCIVEFNADDMVAARRVLGAMRGLGFDTDVEYGIVPLDATLTHFAARGRGTSDVLRSVQESLGARIFSDEGVGET